MLMNSVKKLIVYLNILRLFNITLQTEKHKLIILSCAYSLFCQTIPMRLKIYNLSPQYVNIKYNVLHPK